MARVKVNNITRGMSGRIGELVFRQREGKTIVCKKPKPYPPPTPLQLEMRARFAMAVSKARAALQDPSQIEFFKPLAKKNQKIFNVALQYYPKQEVAKENIKEDIVERKKPQLKKRIPLRSMLPSFTNDFIPSFLQTAVHKNVPVADTS